MVMAAVAVNMPKAPMLAAIRSHRAIRSLSLSIREAMKQIAGYRTALALRLQMPFLGPMRVALASEWAALAGLVIISQMEAPVHLETLLSCLKAEAVARRAGQMEPEH
jgi:hypothetical protein